jgi:uncharacterized RDD family membrane protein YckC
MSDATAAGQPSLPPSLPSLPAPAPTPPLSPAWVNHDGTRHGQTAGAPYGVAPRPTLKAVSPWGRLGAYLLEGILMVVTLWIGWVIWAAAIGGGGQTPAKRLLKYRVINAETQRPASLGKMFWVRGFLAGIVAYFAILFTLGIILFMPFWDKRNQNIWDKVSNCYVVYDANDQWGTKPDLR